MQTSEIRSKFLEYFRDNGHKIMPSGSLVPANDPSLLFTNAGMVPFKNIFLGEEKLDCSRATSSQCCVRAGGKHNDLDNVGYTARHHTLFEMLGNFSFGDYFKEEAIKMAWHFLTEELKLPQDRLWVTVFEDDDEAESIWLNKIGVDKARFSRCGAEDNFWSMGDTGPCGPCTEIFYDHGPEVAGGPPGTAEADGDRYVEIWNLVFMQYNRDSKGEMTNLPKPSVDTGMGLERIAAVMQGVHSNYDIDLFKVLIAAARKILSCPDDHFHAMCVIADHIRASCFLMIDGVVPSNEGRGYVLRRIIRRALRHGYQINQQVDFMHKMVPALLDAMGQAYPKLNDNQQQLTAMLAQEEQQFSRTLANGMQLLETSLAEVSNGILSGEIAFLLYDTYGFPLDLTEDIAREQDITVDHKSFEQAMQEQRERSQSAGKFKVDYGAALDDLGSSEFVGYGEMTVESELLACVHSGEKSGSLGLGQEGILVLAETPFYAESGGQVGDRGELRTGDGALFKVEDTQRHGDAICHHGRVLEGEFSVGATVQAEVDECRRETRCHHTATHLLHAALRQVLGDKVVQKGSLVAPDRLRFDFSWTKGLTAAQLQDAETMVNRVIQANIAVETEVMMLEDARKRGAMALFGEKYADQVRVLSIGGFSIELCGGTHVAMTGEIGLFKIISEEGVAQGVRRIEALTGMVALAWVAERLEALQQIAQTVKVPALEVLGRVRQIQSEHHDMSRQIAKQAKSLRQQDAADLYKKSTIIKDVRVVIANVPGMSAEGLRDCVDQLKNRDEAVACLLYGEQAGKLMLVMGISKAVDSNIRAGDWMKHITSEFGGKGGGRADLAQGGGIAADKAGDMSSFATDWLKSRLEQS